jgi:hypothetical protein
MVPFVKSDLFPGEDTFWGSWPGPRLRAARSLFVKVGLLISGPKKP